jgi:putative alpha-1,2-mannosidase
MVQAQQTSFVNPFIGTSDDHGQTDPSATIPFGMIKPGQKLYLAETEVMIINHNS